MCHTHHSSMVTLFLRALTQAHTQTPCAHTHTISWRTIIPLFIVFLGYQGTPGSHLQSIWHVFYSLWVCGCVCVHFIYFRIIHFLILYRPAQLVVCRGFKVMFICFYVTVWAVEHDVRVSIWCSPSRIKPADWITASLSLTYKATYRRILTGLTCWLTQTVSTKKYIFVLI